MYFRATSEYLSIVETLYPMRYCTACRHYNPKKMHCYAVLWKSLNGASFPYTYKSVPYTAKPQARHEPNHMKVAINYLKYLV